MSSMSRADTQIIPCLLTSLSTPISALIVSIIISFHLCKLTCCTITSLVFHTSHFPCTASFAFLSSPLSPFSFIISPPVPSLHLPGHLPSPSVFGTVPPWSLCVPCKLLPFFLSLLCLASFFLLFLLMISSLFKSSFFALWSESMLPPGAFRRALHVVPQQGATLPLCFIDYQTAFLEWCTQSL